MLLFALALLAQLQVVPPPDTLSGGGGWVGAGLLGLVLAWLLFWHLPAKDKQIGEVIDKHAAEAKATRDDFKTALASIMAHCEGKVDRVAGDLAEARDENRREHKMTRHLAGNIAHTLGLKLAAGTIRVGEDDEGDPRPKPDSKFHRKLPPG